MNDTRMVCHDGTVIERKDTHVRVKIVARSACADCHAKGMCTAADMQEKIIDAVTHEPLQVGDTVTIVMEEKMGWLAVLYGFVLPFVLLIAVLFGLYLSGRKETDAALYAIGSLVPYYILLYIFREKIEKDFVFKAEKKK
jgi:sigma-E factor negative regulatory protein RseC